MGPSCTKCAQCSEKVCIVYHGCRDAEPKDGKIVIGVDSNLSPEQELQCFHDFVNGHVIDRHSHHGLHEAFNKLGGKDDDLVQRDEMVRCLTKTGYPGNPSHLFDIFDVDKSDFISKEEFVASTKMDFIESGPIRKLKRFFEKKYPAAHYDESLNQAFHEMDIHAGIHTEVVCRDDFCALLERQKYTGHAGIAYELLDRNHDETVTYGEFKKRLHNVTRHKLLEKV